MIDWCRRLKMKLQAGILPYVINANGNIEILLITSKRSGKWSIPKGNVKQGEKFIDAAVREAEEEAGITGEVSSRRLPLYKYERRSKQYGVKVYPLKVTVELNTWKEDKLRKRQWFEKSNAAKVVKNRELSEIISGFEL